MDDEMAAIRAAKKELRAKIRQKLSQFSAGSIAKQSITATENLISLPEYRDAKRIGIYLSMPKGELSTRDIVHDAFQQGKQIFVPYINKSYVGNSKERRSVMDMVTLHSVNDYENLKPDAWGIPSIPEESVDERHRVLGETVEILGGVSQKPSDSERRDEVSRTRNERLDLIVMPGVAFDRSLGRVGHGKGFYDYFLERYQQSKSGPMPVLVGLSLDAQLLPEDQRVPTDASDYKLDALMVGNGTIIRR